MVKQNSDAGGRLDQLTGQATDGLRRARHAGIGAVALLGEGARGLFDRLAERGASAESDGLESLQARACQVRTGATEVFDAQVQRVVRGMGLATRDDVAELKAQVAELTAALGAASGKAKSK